MRKMQDPETEDLESVLEVCDRSRMSQATQQFVHDDTPSLFLVFNSESHRDKLISLTKSQQTLPPCIQELKVELI